MDSPPPDYALPPTPPEAPLGGRIPSLDGLRALSILLVIIGHVRTTTGMRFEIRRWVTAVPGNASLGVSIFFVISGFLITHLLLRERQKTGRISLGGFYLRRFLRIMPAYYSLLLCLLLLRHFRGSFFDAWHPLDWRNLAVAGVFLTNYSPFHVNEWVGHTWSLSVEEQFYLFWPLLLSLAGRKAAKRVAVGLIIAAPVMRIATFFLVPHDSMLWQRIPFMLHTRVDALMFGCATALFYSSPRFQELLRRAFARRLHLLALVFVFIVSPYLEVWSEPSVKVASPPQPYLVLAGYSLEGVCIVLLLVWAVENPGRPVGRLLNWGPVVHIGLISYSLYLWQQLFLLGNPTWTGEFPVNLLCAAAAAEVSYRVVERTFLRWRDLLLGSHRYEKPVSVSLSPDARGGGSSDPTASNLVPSRGVAGERVP